MALWSQMCAWFSISTVHWAGTYTGSVSLKVLAVWETAITSWAVNAACTTAESYWVATLVFNTWLNGWNSCSFFAYWQRLGAVISVFLNTISKEKLRRFYYIAQLLVQPSVVLVNNLANIKWELTGQVTCNGDVPKKSIKECVVLVYLLWGMLKKLTFT